MKELLKKQFITQNKILLVNSLIDFLEEDLLNYEIFPEEYLLFVEEIFSSESLFSSENSWKILHLLATENLSTEQYHRLSSTICDNFNSYCEYMLCDMSCDFIARTCLPEHAVDLLEKLINKCADDIHRRSILVGLNVLLTHACNSDDCRHRVRMLANRISK